jgi:hypothetical protein
VKKNKTKQCNHLIKNVGTDHADLVDDKYASGLYPVRSFLLCQNAMHSFFV